MSDTLHNIIGFNVGESASSPSKAVLCVAAARTPMAPACVKLWKRCLQDLQQLPDLTNDRAALVVTAVKVSATLDQWRELPPLSARDWRKLVLEVKVWGATCILQRLSKYSIPAANLL